MVEDEDLEELEQYVGLHVGFQFPFGQKQSTIEEDRDEEREDEEEGDMEKDMDADRELDCEPEVLLEL